MSFYLSYLYLHKCNNALILQPILTFYNKPDLHPEVEIDFIMLVTTISPTEGSHITHQSKCENLCESSCCNFLSQ